MNLMEEPKQKGKLRLPKRAASLAGALLSGIAAAGASAIAAGHSWQTVVPLAFSAVLLVVAVVFGMQAGIAGTVLAALVFAGFLFSPLGSVRVASDAARSNIGWMLLIGLGFSLLFAPPASGLHRH